MTPTTIGLALSSEDDAANDVRDAVSRVAARLPERWEMHSGELQTNPREPTWSR